MGSLPIAAALSITAAVLLGAAVWRYRIGSPRSAFLLILAAGLLLRCAAATDHFLHPWDERYHALVAKNMIDQPLRPTLYRDPVLPYDTTHWFSNHVWLHKPPLTMWLMAGGIRIIGIDEIGLRLPGVLLSTLAIIATWGIGRRLFNDRIALLAAGLHAANGQLLDLAGGRVPSDHVDSLAIVLISFAFLLALDRRRNLAWPWVVAIGGLTGAVLLTKSAIALLVPVVWAVAAWRSDRPWQIVRKTLLLLAVAAAIWMPWQLHIRAEFPIEANWESEYAIRHLFEVLEEHDQPWWFFFQQLFRTAGLTAWIAIAWFTTHVLRKGATAEGRAILVWIAIPTLVFTLASTKMPAYASIAAPAVFLAIASFWWRLHDASRHDDRHPIRRTGLVVLMVLTLLLPAVYTVERLKLHPGYDRNPVWAQQLRELPRILGPGPAVIFGSDHAIETMFYTPYIAYPHPSPSGATIRSLRDSGYRVFVSHASEPGVPVALPVR